MLVRRVRAGLDVQRREEFIVQLAKRCNRHRLPRLGQAHGHKPGVHRVGQARNPSARFVIDHAAGYQPADQGFHLGLDPFGLRPGQFPHPDCPA
ncbi:MAG: hypothetical protein ABSB74_10095 [Tepidisphaeraceae bacterium]